MNDQEPSSVELELEVALEADSSELASEEHTPSQTEEVSTLPQEEPPVPTAPWLDEREEDSAERRTISEKKLAANRANAQRSTGPKTSKASRRADSTPSNTA